MASVLPNIGEPVRGNATDKVLNSGCHTFSFTIFNIREKKKKDVCYIFISRRKICPLPYVSQLQYYPVVLFVAASYFRMLHISRFDPVRKNVKPHKDSIKII